MAQYIIKNFGLTPTQCDKLERYTRQHRASEAAVVRDALDAWFANQEKEGRKDEVVGRTPRGS